MTTSHIASAAGRCAVAASLLAGLCAGQQRYVWPNGYATKEANSSQAAPFSVNDKQSLRGSRSVTLFSARTLPFQPGRNIVAIGYRRDCGDRTTYAALSGSYQVRIGPVDDALMPGGGPRDPWSAAPQTIAQGSLSLAAQSPPGKGPAPFSIQLPFSTPWPWTGGDFAVDVVFSTGSATMWNRDAAWYQPRVDADVTPLGPGCAGTVGLAPQAWVDSATAVLGGQITALLQGVPLPLGVAPIMVLGTRSSPRSLAPLMPSGCMSWIMPTMTRQTIASVGSSRFGYAAATVAVPNVPTVLGAALGMQWLVPDPGVGTRVPYVVSNALEVKVGTPAPQTPDYGLSAWGYGSTNLGDDYTAQAGPPSYVPVTEFSVQ